MSICREIHAGYVKCDIDGDGYNMINVCGCEYEDARFDYRRTSRCYGNVEHKGLTADELLSVLDEEKWLIATRDAHQSFLGLRKDVRREGRGKKEPKAKASVPSSNRVQFFVDDRPVTSGAAVSMSDLARATAVTTTAMSGFLSEWERILLTTPTTEGGWFSR